MTSAIENEPFFKDFEREMDKTSAYLISLKENSLKENPKKDLFRVIFGISDNGGLKFVSDYKKFFDLMKIDIKELPEKLSSLEISRIFLEPQNVNNMKNLILKRVKSDINNEADEWYKYYPDGKNDDGAEATYEQVRKGLCDGIIDYFKKSYIFNNDLLIFLEGKGFVDDTITCDYFFPYFSPRFY